MTDTSTEDAAGSGTKTWAAAVLVIAAAVFPYVFHHTPEFKSDDILLIARGVETGIFEGLVRNFTRPFCDTWTIEFYRPLFTFSYCLEGHIFGADPRGYFWLNVAWHALAMAAGYFVLARLLNVKTALFASLLFAANPWSANNVGWLVGRCTVVCALCVWLAVLAYRRYVDRGRTGLPWLAFSFATVGVFYRETALFAPVLIFLIDVFSKRRDLRAWRDWTFLTLPFVVYMVVKFFVLGTFVGGYARMEDLRGKVEKEATRTERAKEISEAVLDLFCPGYGDDRNNFDPLAAWVGSQKWSPEKWQRKEFAQPLQFGRDQRRSAIWTLVCAAVATLFLNGLLGGMLKRKSTWIILLFTVVNAAPLLAIDVSVHAGTAQRWYVIMWGIGALATIAMLSGKSRPIGLVAWGILFLSNGLRLHENLAEYDKASRVMTAVRTAIKEAPEDTVVVYNVKVHAGASAFYSVGLGQTQLPPFADGKKAAYPVFVNHQWGPDEKTQALLGPVLLSRGQKVGLLWIDYEKGVCGAIPQAQLEQVAPIWNAMPRLVVHSPKEIVTKDAVELLLDCDTMGCDRIDVYLHTQVAQSVLHHARRGKYKYAEFTADGRFKLQLRTSLEYASLMPSPAEKGRSFLWVVAYEKEATAQPKAWSDFYEIWSAVPHEKPTR